MVSRCLLLWLRLEYRNRGCCTWIQYGDPVVNKIFENYGFFTTHINQSAVMSDPRTTREDYLKVITELKKATNNELMLMLKSAEDDHIG